MAKKVKVKIKPLRGIGGYGFAGEEVKMPEDEAKQYEKDGYVTILGGDADEPEEPEKATPPDRGAGKKEGGIFPPLSKGKKGSSNAEAEDKQVKDGE